MTVSIPEEKSVPLSVTGRRCVELLAGGGLSEGVYVSTIQNLARLEPQDRSAAWDELKKVIEPDAYWQVLRDYQTYLRRGHF